MAIASRKVQPLVPFDPVDANTLAVAVELAGVMLTIGVATACRSQSPHQRPLIVLRYTVSRRVRASQHDTCYKRHSEKKGANIDG